MLAATALATLAAAHHPFVGEHADASSIVREDGSVAMKMTKRYTKGLNKYSTMIDRSRTHGPQMSVFDMLKEHIFGKSEEKQARENAVKMFVEKNAKKMTRDGHKKLGQNHIGLTLETLDSATWTGTIYMGRFTPIDVVFDTGSDWLVIESHLCDTCEGNTYDTSTSTLVGNKISERTYGSATLKGVEHHDTVCTLLSACVYEFEYFAIYEQFGIGEPIDGVLGLARPNTFYYSGYEGTGKSTYGPLYLQEMYQQGLIDQRTVSFYFNGRETSYVDFGTPQTNAMRNKDDMEWFDMIEDDFFWSTFNQAIGIGSTEKQYVFGFGSADKKFGETINTQTGINSVYSIFDTGLGAIMISGTYFDDLVEYIFRYVGGDDYQVYEGFIFSKCYSNFPDLYFMFQEKWVKVDADEYVFDVSTSQDGSECLLLIVGLDAPYNIFGTPIFQGYYTVHE